MTNSLDFLKSYFTDEDYFFITLIDKTTKRAQNYHHNINSFSKNLNLIKSKNRTHSVYFTLNSFKPLRECTLNDYKRPTKTKENVSHINALIFDFDNPSTSKSNLTNLIKSLNIKPTYIVQTSKDKFQICFKLNDKDINFKEYELINKTLATYFESDINVCTVEKLFRLPFFVNKKSDFEVQVVKHDFSINYNFEYFKDFVLNNENTKLIYEELFLKKVKIKSPVLKKQSTTKVDFIFEELETLEEKFLKRYRYFLKQNHNDASVVDVIYINSRKKETQDFNLVFNEILYLRELCNKPVKRNLEDYFKDREKTFLDTFGISEK